MKNSYLTKLALIGLLATSVTVQAGAAKKAAAPTAAQNCQSFRLDLTGGWWKAIDNVPGYGIVGYHNNDGFFSNGALLRVDPDTKFTGAITVGYQLPICPLSLNFTYWKAKSTGDESAAGDIGITRLHPRLDHDFATSAQASADYSNDLFNLFVSTDICATKCLTISPQLGVAYYRSKSDQNVRYDDLYDVNNQSGAYGSAFNHSKFDGWGLSFGSSAIYRLMCNFSLYGNFTYFGFVGSTDASYATSSVDLANNLVADRVNLDTHHGIVSLLFSEIALAYDFLCCDAYTGKVMVGYNISKALDSTRSNAWFVDNVAPATLVSFADNSGFYGPFIRLSFTF